MHFFVNMRYKSLKLKSPPLKGNILLMVQKSHSQPPFGCKIPYKYWDFNYVFLNRWTHAGFRVAIQQKGRCSTQIYRHRSDCKTGVPGWWNVTVKPYQFHMDPSWVLRDNNKIIKIRLPFSPTRMTHVWCQWVLIKAQMALLFGEGLFLGEKYGQWSIVWCIGQCPRNLMPLSRLNLVGFGAHRACMML